MVSPQTSQAYNATVMSQQNQNTHSFNYESIKCDSCSIYLNQGSFYVHKCHSVYCSKCFHKDVNCHQCDMKKYDDFFKFSVQDCYEMVGEVKKSYSDWDEVLLQAKQTANLLPCKIKQNMKMIASMNDKLSTAEKCREAIETYIEEHKIEVTKLTHKQKFLKKVSNNLSGNSNNLMNIIKLVKCNKILALSEPDKIASLLSDHRKSLVHQISSKINVEIINEESAMCSEKIIITLFKDNSNQQEAESTSVFAKTKVKPTMNDIVDDDEISRQDNSDKVDKQIELTRSDKEPDHMVVVKSGNHIILKNIDDNNNNSKREDKSEATNVSCHNNSLNQNSSGLTKGKESKSQAVKDVTQVQISSDNNNSNQQQNIPSKKRKNASDLSSCTADSSGRVKRMSLHGKGNMQSSQITAHKFTNKNDASKETNNDNPNRKESQAEHDSKKGSAERSSKESVKSSADNVDTVDGKTSRIELGCFKRSLCLIKKPKYYPKEKNALETRRKVAQKLDPDSIYFEDLDDVSEWEESELLPEKLSETQIKQIRKGMKAGKLYNISYQSLKIIYPEMDSVYRKKKAERGVYFVLKTMRVTETCSSTSNIVILQAY